MYVQYEYLQPGSSSSGSKRGRREKKKKESAALDRLGWRAKELSRCPTHQNPRIRPARSNSKTRCCAALSQVSCRPVGCKTASDGRQSNAYRCPSSGRCHRLTEANTIGAASREAWWPRPMTGQIQSSGGTDRTINRSKTAGPCLESQQSGYCDCSDFAAARLGRPTPSLGKGASREHVPASSGPLWRRAVPFSMVPPVYSSY